MKFKKHTIKNENRIIIYYANDYTNSPVNMNEDDKIFHDTVNFSSFINDEISIFFKNYFNWLKYAVLIFLYLMAFLGIYYIINHNQINLYFMFELIKNVALFFLILGMGIFIFAFANRFIGLKKILNLFDYLPQFILNICLLLISILMLYILIKTYSLLYCIAFMVIAVAIMCIFVFIFKVLFKIYMYYKKYVFIEISQIR